MVTTLKLQLKKLLKKLLKLLKNSLKLLKKLLKLLKNSLKKLLKLLKKQLKKLLNNSVQAIISGNSPRENWNLQGRESTQVFLCPYPYLLARVRAFLYIYQAITRHRQSRMMPAKAN